MLLTLLSPDQPDFRLLAVEFIASALVVLFLALKLSKYSDALEQTGLISAVWIGTFFLAIVTSLPEAVTSIGAAIIPEAAPLWLQLL